MIGENLNQYSQNLKVIKALDAEELRLKLGAFRIPVSVISIYAEKGYHYAWIMVAGVRQEKIDELNESKPKRKVKKK